MPAGVPVGTLAIGRSGAVNAALLAAAVLALSDSALAERLDACRARQTGAVADASGGQRVSDMLAPGSTIGIIGGGQLGRMLAMAAARLGYRTIVLEPQPDCPAAQVANRQIEAAYDDAAALDELAEAADVVTYEFENVPIEAANRLASKLPVYPPPRALEISQDRLTEKRFLNAHGISTAGFQPVDNDGDIATALQAFGGQGVLKNKTLRL